MPSSFYGIGNHALVKHRKDTGERVAEWFGPRGGPIIHFNSGYVDGERLVLAAFEIFAAADGELARADVRVHPNRCCRSPAIVSEYASAP